MSSKEPAEASNNGRKKEDSIFTKPRWPSSRSRRSPSLSSSSSSSLSSSSNSASSFKSSAHGISPPPSPEGGIPFSWESIPGIPKKQMILNKIDSSRKINYLPLPPAATPVSSSPNKFSTHKRLHFSATRKDPFFAALIECSKTGTGDDKAAFGRLKLSKSLSFSDRFGFANMSCKNASAITESLVFLPKSPHRIPFDKVKNRSR